MINKYLGVYKINKRYADCFIPIQICDTQYICSKCGAICTESIVYGPIFIPILKEDYIEQIRLQKQFGTTGNKTLYVCNCVCRSCLDNHIDKKCIDIFRKVYHCWIVEITKNRDGIKNIRERIIKYFNNFCIKYNLYGDRLTEFFEKARQGNIKLIELNRFVQEGNCVLAEARSKILMLCMIFDQKEVQEYYDTSSIFPSKILCEYINTVRDKKLSNIIYKTKIKNPCGMFLKIEKRREDFLSYFEELGSESEIIDWLRSIFSKENSYR